MGLIKSVELNEDDIGVWKGATYCDKCEDLHCNQCDAKRHSRQFEMEDGLECDHVKGLNRIVYTCKICGNTISIVERNPVGILSVVA